MADYVRPPPASVVAVGRKRRTVTEARHRAATVVVLDACPVGGCPVASVEADRRCRTGTEDPPLAIAEDASVHCAEGHSAARQCQAVQCVDMNHFIHSILSLES